MNAFTHTFFFFSLIVFPVCSFAQENNMLIEQIQNKTINRQNFDSKGVLTGKQVFEVGNLQQSGKNYLLNIQVKLYDETSKLKSTYSTTYQCRPGESNVLLSVFTVKPRKQKISVSVKSGDFKKMYDLDKTSFLSDLKLIMNIESGILNFLGSKNIVEITGRNLSKQKNENRISEKLVLKAYLLGFKIKTISYDVTELLSSTGILESQVFK